MAHRAVAAALALAALFILPLRPLVSLVFLGAALAVVMDHRSAFGTGMYRSILAFNASLWLTVLGVATSLIGLVPFGSPCGSEPCQGNFLLLPGLLILGAGITLLAWSVVWMIRTRRAGE